MPATWYLFQFTRDTRAHEPRNVGLALRVHSEDPQWYFYFRGINDHGSIDARQLTHLGMDKDVYTSWIDYYQRKAHDDDWDTALTLQHRRPSNFGVVTGGTLLEDHPDWEAEAFRLFLELVDQPKNRSESIVDSALRIFREASIEPRRNVTLEGRWTDDGGSIEIPFRFGVQNGTLRGIDAAPASLQDLSWMKQRMEAVARGNESRKTVAMVPVGSQPDQGESLEALLTALEKDGYVLDMDDERASSNLREMIFS